MCTGKKKYMFNRFEFTRVRKLLCFVYISAPKLPIESAVQKFTAPVALQWIIRSLHNYLSGYARYGAYLYTYRARNFCISMIIRYKNSYNNNNYFLLSSRKMENIYKHNRYFTVTLNYNIYI